MSAVTAAEFKLNYRRFRQILDEDIQPILDRVERLHCSYDAWKDWQKDGIMLLTAHTLDLEYKQEADIGSLAGNVAKGQASGSLSSVSEDWLLLTPQGVEFKGMRDNLLVITGLGF